MWALRRGAGEQRRGSGRPQDVAACPGSEGPPVSQLARPGRRGGGGAALSDQLLPGPRIFHEAED